MFNVLEIFDRGPFITYLIDLVADSADRVEAFEKLCDAKEIPFEDWNSSVRQICKACSEGRPHAKHDHKPVKISWKPERQVAVAARDEKEVAAVIDAWDGTVTEWGPALER